jgi:hypothetical protein
MQRCYRVWLAASSLMLMSGAAWAAETHGYPECTTRPSDNDLTAAKGAFQAGTVSFNEADYGRAILYWEDAYRRDCTATLLLHHLGRAYEGAGNLEQAVIALRTYTERAPDSTERAQVLRRIEAFEQKIADEKRQATQTTERAQPTLTAVPVKAGQQEKAQAPAPPAAAAHASKPFPWAPVAVLAAGGVTALVGGLVYLNAHADEKDVEASCGGDRHNCKTPDGTPNGYLIQQGNDARTRAQIGTGVFYGGLAIAAAGTVWLILDSKKSPQTASLQPPALSPWVTMGSAGVAWQRTF